LPLALSAERAAQVAVVVLFSAHESLVLDGTRNRRTPTARGPAANIARGPVVCPGPGREVTAHPAGTTGKPWGAVRGRTGRTRAAASLGGTRAARRAGSAARRPRAAPPGLRCRWRTRPE